MDNNHLTIKTFMAIMAERDAAIQERNLALDERKRAFAERDMAMLQRDAALAERNSAMQQRDDALASLRFQGQNRHFPDQGQTRHFTDQGQNRNLTDQGQNRNFTDQGQNRNLTNQRQNHNLTDQGQNRNFADQGQNRHSTDQGQNRNFTDQGQNRNFTDQDLHHILQLPEETQLEEVEVSTENENPKLKGVKVQKGGRRRGESVKLEEFDEVEMAVPVCSCTGVPQPCYRWGSGGWQSACCTTNMSVYPLPQVSNKKYSRVGGRKMSGGAFSKLLTRLASEGYDLSAPLDLKEHWAKHGTNRYSTVK